GDDMITGVFVPEVQRGSFFAASFDGERGNDSIGVNVDLSKFTPESGELLVSANGGLGSDHLMLLVEHGTDKRMENAQITLDGGLGEDFAIVSSLVDVTNVEHTVIE